MEEKQRGHDARKQQRVGQWQRGTADQWTWVTSKNSRAAVQWTDRKAVIRAPLQDMWEEEMTRNADKSCKNLFNLMNSNSRVVEPNQMAMGTE